MHNNNEGDNFGSIVLQSLIHMGHSIQYLQLID